MKIINRFIPFILIFLLSGFITAKEQTTEVRTFSGINGVAILGSGDVSITLGNKEEITIHAPADLIPYLKTDLKDGTLYIGKRKMGWKNIIRFNDQVHYELIVKQISDISVSGSSDVEAEKLKGNNCSVKISGSGNIEVDQVNSKEFKVQISGSGDVDISNLNTDILDATINGSGNIDIDGKTDNLDVTISGSGDFTADDLKSNNAEIAQYGSGNSSVWVTETLNIHISGSGDVQYKGDPSIRSRTTGSGDISHR